MQHINKIEAVSKYFENIIKIINYFSWHLLSTYKGATDIVIVCTRKNK